MKDFLKYLFRGIIVAVIGMVFAGGFASIFNGIDAGAGCAVGIGVYLCIVMVTCTGILAAKLENISKEK